MSNRLQFRLRSLFYLTSVAAVLCLLLPPCIHAARQYFSSKPRIQTVTVPGDGFTIEVAAPPVTATLPGDTDIPTDATFIQVNIIRVNGQRIDVADDDIATTPAPAEQPIAEEVKKQ
ncbi:MAG TPA: hypothetical protein VFI31_21300 [Pirellulales bacterium]|nr:hypothetical protein [Pirellulales bacterium]